MKRQSKQTSYKEINQLLQQKVSLVAEYVIKMSAQTAFLLFIKKFLFTEEKSSWNLSHLLSFFWFLFAFWHLVCVLTESVSTCMSKPISRLLSWCVKGLSSVKGESRNLTRMNEGKLSKKGIHKYRIYSCDVKWFSSLSITIAVVYRATFRQQGLTWLLCFRFDQSGLFALFAFVPGFVSKVYNMHSTTNSDSYLYSRQKCM